MVKVKICGITSLEDAVLSVECGADAVGFVFYVGSSRMITPEAARDIICRLPPFVSKVGVFVDSPLDEVKQIMRFCGLDLAQLHGDEGPDFCEALFPRAFKAFRVDGRRTLARVDDYRAPACLLDTYKPGVVGGTGETFDWEIAKSVSASRRVVLAGGLNPTNIGRAIAVVRPYGVDVTTGVEASPGKKEPGLIRAFIKAVKRVGDDK